MKGKVLKITVALFCMAIMGCTTDDETLNVSPCKISTITSDEFVFEFKYNADDNLFFINQDFLLAEPEPIQLNLYVKPIGQDSVILGRLQNTFSFDEPRLTAKYQDGIVIQSRRFIPSRPANSVMDFDYNPERIRITVDYDDAISMQRTVTYGDYILNADGNVIRVEKYVYDEERENATLFEEADYSYDSANNPWKGQVYPLLFCTDLPDPKFFSTNNALTKTTASGTETYSFSYDADNRTISGDVPIFNSCTTTSEASQETYTYIDCD